MFDPENLKLTSKERFMAACNHKTARWMFITDEAAATKYDLPINAELLDIVEVKGNKAYNGRATFRIDKEPNESLPIGITASKNKYFHRGIYIRRMSATELVNKFGVNGTVVIQPSAKVETTWDLIPLFKEQFGLVMEEADLVKEAIPETSDCILIRFDPQSLAFTGSFRLKLLELAMG